MLFTGGAGGNKKSEKQQSEHQGQDWRKKRRSRYSLLPLEGPTPEQMHAAACGEPTSEQRKSVMSKWQQRETNVYWLQPPRFCFMLPESIIKYLF